MYKKCIGKLYVGQNILLGRSGKSMEERKKEKIKKPPTKQVHLECDMALYNKFEEYCYRNGKDVSKTIRSFMKMCIGE